MVTLEGQSNALRNLFQIRQALDNVAYALKEAEKSVNAISFKMEEEEHVISIPNQLQVRINAFYQTHKDAFPEKKDFEGHWVPRTYLDVLTDLLQYAETHVEGDEDE